MFLNGDLSDSDIYEFDFQGVDLKRYDLHNVAINSSILIENGLYDDTYYNKTIVPLINHNNVLIKNNDCDNITILHENDILPYQSGDFIKRASIYYISDIHLDEKLVKKFRNHATKYEIEQYIENIVDKMVNSIAFEFVSKYILIAGDVSASFEISKIFYKKLVENGRINPSHIICVLGNHELWNVGRPLNSKVDDIIELYRKMFNKLNITFLQNDLLIDNSEIEVISEAKLISMSDEELKQKTISRIKVTNLVLFIYFSLISFIFVLSISNNPIFCIENVWSYMLIHYFFSFQDFFFIYNTSFKIFFKDIL